MMGAKHKGPFRVLMVAPTSFFGHYGGHIRILEEAKALQNLGHQVTIVTYSMGQDVAGLDIRRTARLPYHADYQVGSSRHKIAFDFYLLVKVLQVGLSLRPDIIHGHMHEGALIGGLLARLLGRPLVFDFQGSLTGEMLDHHFIRGGGLRHRLFWQLERFICHLPQAILTSSLRAENLLGQQFGVRPEQIYPLPDCADLDHFDPAKISSATKAALRQQFQIPAGRPIAVYLGLLADYQGTHHLVEAAALLKQSGREVHFLIMGYPNEEQYRQQAESLGVADRVTFTGRVDYALDAPRFLSLGDVALAPKISASEGSGKVLNYMAMGQPVVAYDNPVHHEYLGEWGVYVPAGEIATLSQAIASLLDDPQRRHTLGQQLRQRAASHFSWAPAGAKIAEWYGQLIHND